MDSSKKGDIGAKDSESLSSKVKEIPVKSFEDFQVQFDTPSEKLVKKVKESPFMPVGVAGLVLACGIGAYRFKNRGEMSPSVYLMRLRIIAQGAVVGSLALGVAYAMFQEYIWNPLKEEKAAHKKD